MTHETARDTEGEAPGAEGASNAERQSDFWAREPDIIGALSGANQQLDAAARWMTLGGNPVQPEDLAAQLHRLSGTLWHALFAVHPWPWAYGDLEIEGKMKRAAALASEMEQVLGELAQKPVRDSAGPS
ncbi:hypothetical protein [Streptomyces mirabilis]|uniref:hypothetical protein n=1 Tax=Streptomyces mirabilis TaxID=68239 RepID=UPI00167D3108|nr:hypothetical protein [Streptomyces mirabilis]GHD49029.1 hypothetical protein GCM10010317_027300 [Streptomyces mirabilis]